MWHSVVCLTGKSSLLSALGNREVPIPDHIDIYHLQHEMAPSDKTALHCVMEVDAERVRLEHEAEQLSTMSSDGTTMLLALLLCTSSSCGPVAVSPRVHY